MKSRATATTKQKKKAIFNQHLLMLEFQEAIHKRREKLGLSCEQIGVLVGSSKQNIQQILEIKGNTSLRSICEIAAVVGLKPVFKFHEARTGKIQS